jgi:hypothetical protein
MHAYTCTRKKVYLKGADKLWAQVSHPKTRKNADINMCAETFSFLSVAERIPL